MLSVVENSNGFLRKDPANSLSVQAFSAGIDIYCPDHPDEYSTLVSTTYLSACREGKGLNKHNIWTFGKSLCVCMFQHLQKTTKEDFSLERENYSPGRALGEHSAKTHKYSTQ